MKDKINRRRFLAACGMTGITLSGCLSRSSGSGDGGDGKSGGKNGTKTKDSQKQDGEQGKDSSDTESKDSSDEGTDGTATSSTSFDYRQWLLNPEEINGKSYDQYGYMVVDFPKILENKDRLGQQAMSSLEQTRNSFEKTFGFGIDKICGFAVSYPASSSVFRLSMSEDEIVDAVKKVNDKFENLGEHQGYKLFSYTWKPKNGAVQKGIYGVKDSTLVGTDISGQNTGKEVGLEILKKTIDTGEGKLKSLTQANSDLKLLSQELEGVVQRVAYRPGSYSSSIWEGIETKPIGNATSWKFGDGVADMENYLLFEEKPSSSAVEKWRSSIKKMDVKYEEMNISTEGRTAVLNLQIPYEEMSNIFFPGFSASLSSDSGSGSGGSETGTSDPPRVNFKFEQEGKADEKGSTLTIMHAGGDNIDNTDGGSLKIMVGKKPAPKQFAEEEIRAGDSVTIDISEAETGQSVRIIWINKNDKGQHRTTIDSYRLK